MSDMIERVARALYAKSHAPKDFDHLDYGLKLKYAGLAKAAIEAMRKPTELMLERGATMEPRSRCEGVYGLMIDAALKD